MANYRTVRSRLAKQEAQKSYKRFIFASLGTLFLILFMLFAGLPALIKFSAFLGEIKTGSQPIISTEEKAPLLPPRIEPLPDATNNPQIAVSGFAQAEKEVEIILNNGESSGKTTAGIDGKFLFSSLTLKDGENRLRAYTLDGGEKSESSETIFVTLKKSAPKLEVSKPEDGTSFSGESSKTIRIEGQSDPDVTVTVNNRWAIVSSSGSFYLSYTLSNGENILKFTVKDQAGNETTTERKVSYSP